MSGSEDEKERTAAGQQAGEESEEGYQTAEETDEKEPQGGLMVRGLSWVWGGVRGVAGAVKTAVVGDDSQAKRDLSRASIVNRQDDESFTSRHSSRRSRYVSQGDPDATDGEEAEKDEEESKQGAALSVEDEQEDPNIGVAEASVGPGSESDDEQGKADLSGKKSQKTPLLKNSPPGPFARFFALPWRRNLAIFLLAVLLGVGAALLVHFVFPAAVLSFAAYMGVAGPWAPILPLLVLGFACAFLTAGIASFPALKHMLFKQDAEIEFFPTGFSIRTLNRYYEVEDQLFMIRLIGLSVLIAGIGLGVFMAATLPAVFTFLSFSLTGLGGTLLSFILAAIISFAFIAVIAYLLYRGSGMQERRAVLTAEFADMNKTAGAEIDIINALGKTQNLACPSQAGKKADYIAATSAFTALAARPDCATLGIVDVIQWQLKLVKLCQGTEDYKKIASTLRDTLLIELAKKIKGYDPSKESEGYGYWEEAFGFCFKLAQSKETSPLWESWGENEMTFLGSQYMQLESSLPGFSDKGEPIEDIREVLAGIYRLLSPRDKPKQEWMVQRGAEAERVSALQPGVSRARADSEDREEGASFNEPVRLRRSAAPPTTSNKQQGGEVRRGPSKQ